jgi:hypothetical protein
VLDWPAGQVLVVIAGLVLIGVGIDQGIKAVKASSSTSPRPRR